MQKDEIISAGVFGDDFGTKVAGNATFDQSQVLNFFKSSLFAGVAYSSDPEAILASIQKKHADADHQFSVGQVVSIARALMIQFSIANKQ